MEFMKKYDRIWVIYERGFRDIKYLVFRNLDEGVYWGWDIEGLRNISKLNNMCML